uniref:CSD domain-containing protein n=1 Tax=Macrostomum lignano TaxID=282301 RepID=A0A1I8GUL3_9PLAT
MSEGRGAARGRGGFRGDFRGGFRGRAGRGEAWRGGGRGFSRSGSSADISNMPTSSTRDTNEAASADQDSSEYRFGYVSSITLGKHGFVSFEDDPSARHGVIFWYYWVQQLNLQVGDRLRYRIEHKGNKTSAVDISRAPLGSSRPEASSQVADLPSNTSQEAAQLQAQKQQVATQLMVRPIIAGTITNSHVLDDRPLKIYHVTTDTVSSFIESLSSKTSNRDIQQLLEVPPGWSIVGQWPRLSADSLYTVLEFFVRVNSRASAYQQRDIGLSIQHLMHEKNFQLDRGACRQLFTEAASKSYSADKVSTLKTFCEMVGQLVPDRCYLIMQLCQQFYDTHFSGKDAFELAKLMCRRFLPVRNSDLSWHELSATLSKEEVLSSTDMGETIRLLPPMQTHAPYDSVADYLETNLKLLRADCFEKLRSGIRQFIGGNLNRRDMTVYHQVELRGIDITHKELSLVLKIEPFNRVVKNWEKSPLLMFGNLLCLSFDETFTEFVCVTVSNRDSGLLNQFGLIFVEPIFESGSIELCDLLRRLRLQKSSLWLAESPTYFQAYRHVLANVQALNGKTLPLEKELVSCTFDSIQLEESDSEDEPAESDVLAYSRDSLTSRWPHSGILRSRLSSAQREKSAIKLFKDEICSRLDESQTQAFRNCTQRKISVIQGPPGCGKTYVGTHLVRYLTAQETKRHRNGPVLLVTYKNNALDEFIRKILTQQSSKVDLIRFGGRSKKTELTKDLDIRSRRDAVQDTDSREQWRLVEEAKKALLEHLENALQTGSCTASSDTNNKTEEEAEEDELNDEQEQIKTERLLASGGDSRTTFSLNLSQQEPSPVRLDQRLIRIVSEKWHTLRYTQNLWELSPKTDFCSCRYERHRDEYKEANLNRDVKICQDVDVIAMTITGASINNELLKRLRPNTVIVEEAAEIMEPMLLGCLGDWTERLFLIGDHKQLRPTVENYELVKHCHLDVSMMERLINCGFPFDCLQFQNRMRPDISKYLKLDVYPDLQDNIDSVKGHDIPSFMPKAVAFWDVENMSESGERSYVNDGEAELIVEVAMTFLRFGYKPSQLTILTPYQGQVRLIRRKLRPRLEDWERDVSNRSALADEANEGFIKVHSIDVYQGDENDIVLVSLVRSEKPGFLASLNRRCVAQSRSHCGLIFIGKASLLRKCAEWSQLLTAFEEDGVLRSDFPGDPRHLKCEEKCIRMLSCGHPCPLKCSEICDSKHCTQNIEAQLSCGHVQSKLCNQPFGTCQESVAKTLPCGHVKQMLCFEWKK